MENKNLSLTLVGIGLIAVLALVMTGITKIGKGIETTNNSILSLSENLKSLNERNLGSVTGPEVYSDTFSINGVKYKYFSSAFNKSSTTVCSFPIKNATSTLIYKSIQNNTATGSALVWEFGKSTLFDATTTLIGNAFNLAANKFLTLVASSSLGVNTDLVFAPNTYSNTKYGGVGSVNNFVGTCKEIFIEN